MARDRAQHELATLAELCTTGRLAEAELHLHAWCRRPDAPVTARLLLASLLARRGAARDALALLERVSHHGPDADAELTRLHIALLIRTGLLDSARRLVRLLHDSQGHSPVIARWLTAIDSVTDSKLTQVSLASVEHLAAELIDQLDVIPSLVAAAVIDPQPADLALLRAAIQRVAADKHDQRSTLMLCTAMAQLAEAAGDSDDARRWAHRGLTIDGYNATLALVLSRIADDLTLGPSAADVLRRVAVAHPQYPDVRASLIRRERQDGRPDTAQIKLAQWLEQDPTNPHALGLVRELAA